MADAHFDIRAFITADRRLTDAVQCYACGVSLGGAQLYGETPDGDEDLDGVCPQCGAPLQPSLSYAIASQVDWLDADGRLNIDHACESCRYNLRTLRIGDHCPECNALVAPRFSTVALQIADSWWLRRVRWGLGLVLISMLAPWGALFLAIIVSLSQRGTPAMWTINASLFIATISMPIVAAFLVTSRHRKWLRSNLRFESNRMAVRHSGRVAAIAVFATVFCMIFVDAYAAIVVLVVVWAMEGYMLARFVVYVGELRRNVVPTPSMKLWHASAVIMALLYYAAPFTVFLSRSLGPVAFSAIAVGVIVAWAVCSCDWILKKYVKANGYRPRGTAAHDWGARKR